jgi:hypothetical protein
MVGIVDCVYSSGAIIYNNTIASSGRAITLKRPAGAVDLRRTWATVGLDKPLNPILNIPSPIP